jgi:hypothetical protein
MTYTEAAAHNKQFNLSETWKDPKQSNDGVHLNWVQDPDGLIGILKNTFHDGTFLVHYPVRVLKVNYKLTVRCWPVKALKDFKELKEEAQQ